MLYFLADSRYNHLLLEQYTTYIYSVRMLALFSYKSQNYLFGRYFS